MKLETLQFGEIEYNPEHVIHFDTGIIGFEQLKKFLFIKPEEDFFYWLNSIDKPELAFPLVGIRLLDEKFPSDEGYEPFGIVTLNRDPAKITVNMKAPVFINQDTKKGNQKIFDLDKYSLNYSLFKE